MKKRVVLFVVLLIVALGSGGFLFSQRIDFHFDRLSDYIYLSSHYQTAMAQDQSGFIWIGSQNGLSRFNDQAQISDEVFIFPYGNFSTIVFDETGGFWRGHFDVHGAAYYLDFDSKNSSFVLFEEFNVDHSGFVIMETLWFYLLFAIILVSAILLIFRVRNSSPRRQKKELAQRIAEQTRKLRGNNHVLKQRTVELDRSNRILEERQKLISDQAEELESQAEHLKKNNQELLKLLKTKDKLFSIIAHDLRTPFNTILGFSSLLADHIEDDDPEQLKSHARYVHDASLSVFNLLENLLYWTRSQTNDIQTRLVQTDLNELILDNISLVRESAIKKDIKVDVAGYNNFPVVADVNMMRTVIRNLLINAVKFTPRNGTVSVLSEERGPEIVVHLKDTGVGMNQQAVDKILRGGGGKTQKGTDGEKGSGLGLVLCNEFISRNNGGLFIESAPGKGSCFSFTLHKGVRKV